MKSGPVRYPIKMRMKAYLMDRGYGTAGQAFTSVIRGSRFKYI